MSDGIVLLGLLILSSFQMHSISMLSGLRSCQYTVRRVVFFILPCKYRHTSSRVGFPCHWAAAPSRVSRSNSRSISSSTLVQLMIPPCVFTGLVATLWVYKCLMLILFQNKIIYMPSIPPFSRSERLSDYQRLCKPVNWQQHYIISSDNVRLSVLTGEISRVLANSSYKDKHSTVIIYFQG